MYLDLRRDYNIITFTDVQLKFNFDHIPKFT